MKGRTLCYGGWPANPTNAGNNRAASIAITAITTSSSIKVKACKAVGFAGPILAGAWI